MGLKKYEIITVGSDKRVRALRSWQVGDRYVNIGDVGGIVYDEKTLSQDGACWLFRGNFNFPGARIGGDSIVDVAETALSTAGAPNVDILGSSVVVGSKLQFESDQTAADFVVLTAADFEQGTIAYAKGVNWEAWKTPSARSVRSKAPIFAGGEGVTLKLEVPGYAVQAYALDRDGAGVAVTNTIESGVGVTLSIPAGQYFVLRLAKVPAADIVPADAAAAQIAFTGTFDTKLSIIDSRVEINPATATGVATIKPGGTHAISPGAKYPEAIIRNSKVSVTVPAAANRTIRFMGQIIGSTAVLDGTAGNLVMAGTYSSVKSLRASGLLASGTGVSAYDCIQATDCDNFAVSPTIFPGLAAMQTAGVPIKFYSCNLIEGRFNHHAQIANTYRDINFDLATADLGKAIASGQILASAEVEGMYRVYSISGSVFGVLLEAHDSVKSLNISPRVVDSYGTTIYKDAYFNGLFDIAGTNVFGNTKKHDTQDVSGCKIVNTGETAVNMKGNIRVEGNATLNNCSIIGSGYFGGNSIAQGLTVEGTVYMKDNAVFAPTITGTPKANILRMTDNASFTGAWSGGGTRLVMSDNARFTSATNHNTLGFVEMHDNASISGSGSAAVSGVLVLQDDASISAGAASISGDITLCGKYTQTASKTWTGKRVIDDQNAPKYDDNVKTKYDF